jgi:hypothetical protein
MRNAIEVIRVTSPKIKERGRLYCQLLDFKASEDEDSLARPYCHIIAHVKNEPSSAVPWATGRHHEQELRLYPPFGQRSPVWMSCSCESFLFVSEVALTLQGNSSIIHSNGKLPNITNPLKIPSACKHMIKVLERTMRDRQVQKIIFGLKIDDRTKKRMP